MTYMMLKLKKMGIVLDVKKGRKKKKKGKERGQREHE